MTNTPTSEEKKKWQEQLGIQSSEVPYIKTSEVDLLREWGFKENDIVYLFDFTRDLKKIVFVEKFRCLVFQNPEENITFANPALPVTGYFKPLPHYKNNIHNSIPKND